jgi:DNA-binding MarR family transcriptional regulator
MLQAHVAELSHRPAAASAEVTALVAIILPLFAVRGQLVELIEHASRDVDIAPTEAVALLHLANQDMTVSEISRAAGLQRSGGSVLVDRLHARRLIKRTHGQRDRRVVMVSPTPRGSRIASVLLEQMSSPASALLQGLGTTDRRRLASGLQRLAAVRV